MLVSKIASFHRKSAMWDQPKTTPKRVTFGANKTIPPYSQPSAPSSSYVYNENGQDPNMTNQQYNSYQNYASQPPIVNNQYPSFPFPNQPMADAAMIYGSSLAGQGKQIVEQKLERWVSLSRLKYYFAVDTKYVGKKLSILLCPYLHKDWALQYDQENQPIAPRFDVNAPDLYIPLMAFLTFILASGWLMGVQKKFSPEQLGIRASTCLVWQIIEVLIVTFMLYIMNIGTQLRILDIFAYCAYKYVGMILCAIIAHFFGTKGYYGALFYFGISIAYFLIKTLRLIILPDASANQPTINYAYNQAYDTNDNSYPRSSTGMTKHKSATYLLLGLCFLVQPLLMFILTYHLIPSSLFWFGAANKLPKF